MSAQDYVTPLRDQGVPNCELFEALVQLLTVNQSVPPELRPMSMHVSVYISTSIYIYIYIYAIFCDIVNAFTFLLDPSHLTSVQVIYTHTVYACTYRQFMSLFSMLHYPLLQDRARHGPSVDNSLLLSQVLDCISPECSPSPQSSRLTQGSFQRVWDLVIPLLLLS